MNLGIINGGDRPNRVPDECRACIDIRLVPPMTIQGILEKVDTCIAGFDGQAEYRVLRTHGALDTPPDAALVQQVTETGKKVCGKPLSINGWRGWTEAESFASRLGVPAVVMGPGALKQAHSSDEFVEMEQVQAAARIYAEAALRILG
jgi:succinyl-diaminopimelate desuccinylase